MVNLDLDREDVPLLGGVISSGAAVLDLLLNSGEIILGLLPILLDPEILLRILSVVDTLGIGIFPSGLLDQLISVLVVALFINFIGSLLIKRISG
jgi:hypothetical protein